MIAGDYKDDVFAGDDFGGYQEVSKESFDLSKGINNRCVECHETLTHDDTDIYLCNKCAEIIGGKDGYDEIDQAEIVRDNLNSND